MTTTEKFLSCWDNISDISESVITKFNLHLYSGYKYSEYAFGTTLCMATTSAENTMEKLQNTYLDYLSQNTF